MVTWNTNTILSKSCLVKVRNKWLARVMDGVMAALLVMDLALSLVGRLVWADDQTMRNQLYVY